MKILYLDCAAGIAGDMLLAALLDCGLSLQKLQNHLSLLPLQGYTLQTRRTQKKELGALQIKIDVQQKQPLRQFSAIKKIIARAALPADVKAKSLAAFQVLAQAESKIHGLPPEKIHFHEIGAVDTLIDVVGCIIALKMLRIEKIWASPLPLGRGRIKAGHGWIPLPAPATMEIIRSYRLPCYGLSCRGETVTPTGAALLSIIPAHFAPLPPIVIEKIGYGAGQKDFYFPNILRAFLGQLSGNNAPAEPRAAGRTTKNNLLTAPLEIIEANIDDLNPEIYAYVLERLLANGALDVYFTPIQMKKNRPAVKITILADPQQAKKLGAILLQETTSLGYRRWSAEKMSLPRKHLPLETPWGKIRLKIAGTSPENQNIAPEYEDCLRIARTEGIPLKKVYQQIWQLLKP